MKTLSILGSTGSIGRQTLAVIDSLPNQFKIAALAAGTNLDELLPQILRHQPELVSVATPQLVGELARRLREKNHSPLPAIHHGAEGMLAAATHHAVEIVVSAAVGVVGLAATYEAVKLGKLIALSNKEVLVAAGELVMAAAKKSGRELLPVDSEHNAIHQCLRAAGPSPSGTVTPDCAPGSSPTDPSFSGAAPFAAKGAGLDSTYASTHDSSSFSETSTDHESPATAHGSSLRRIILTASGGPFRKTPLKDFSTITTEQALNHPNWRMGNRITIDSATMMNKGFEIIEARWLFDARPDQIDVVIHPQSTIHSMVEFVDGSILAQLGPTDMRMPIQYALTYPARLPAKDIALDWSKLRRLDFEKPSTRRFPCLRLAREAMKKGGAHPAALNAADEIAVAAFLEGQLPFLGIPEVIERVLARTSKIRLNSIEDVLNADADARRQAREEISTLSSKSFVAR
jgi:1-deoxy-D-xylulose-5-phosphate reductoisomerase